MEIIHPKTKSDFKQRNTLLQSALRPETLPFGIADEYPIVLSKEGSSYSYCVMEDKKIISHLNLWPRIVVNNQTGAKCCARIVESQAQELGKRQHLKPMGAAVALAERMLLKQESAQK